MIDIDFVVKTDKGDYSFKYGLWLSDIKDFLERKFDTEIDKISWADITNGDIISYFENIDENRLDEIFWNWMPDEFEGCKVLDWDYSFEAFEYD